MTKADMLEKLHAMNWPVDEYWLVAGGAMVMYGLRPETHDLDLGCTARRADVLEAAGVPCRPMSDGNGRWFALSEDVEVFENWLLDRVELVEGVPVVSLQGLRAMKLALGREKDLRDVALIDAFLTKAPDPVDS